MSTLPTLCITEKTRFIFQDLLTLVHRQAAMIEEIRDEHSARIRQLKDEKDREVKVSCNFFERGS